MGNLSAEARKELITKKAFELYQKRGCKPGHEMDDWLEAEKFVDREHGEVKSTPTPTPTTTKTTQQPTPRSIPSPIRNTSKVGYKRVKG